MYRSMKDVVEDLKRSGQLIEVDVPLSSHLEIPEIQRRVYANQGPALLFTRVENCAFPMLGNLFGTLERARFLFRHTWKRVRKAIELKIDPNQFFRRPLHYASAPAVAWTMLPKTVRSGPVLAHETTIGNLPKQVSWPEDGGPFVTLPQVLSLPPGPFRNARHQLGSINLGMYRIQLSGNQYLQDREVGLHYQIHRGIGVHHRAAIEAGRPFPVNIFLGGTPAMTLAAVMPLPEGMSELTFAGALAGHRIPVLAGSNRAPIYADADFCIVGEVDPTMVKPEGPFGDHLGYYSLRHDFPVLQVKKVYHRPGAIWPFTVVGRPPQEDTVFGAIIHELTGPIVPSLIPGIRAVHAVDEAGVHPLLLAIGSERYMPFRSSHRPQELLTQANALLGQGQLSLAKYVLIVDGTDDPSLDIHDIQRFFVHLLERVDWRNDLHFQTRTTIDTLDYSGEGLNEGSKVVIAARGSKRRNLVTQIPEHWPSIPGLGKPKLCLPGVVAIATDQRHSGRVSHLDRTKTVRELAKSLDASMIDCVPLIVLVDDADFTSLHLRNFLWNTFTRSDPARDIYGVGESIIDKHWGCEGPLIIDARCKPHHAPPLIEDSETTAKVDALAAAGEPISRFL